MIGEDEPKWITVTHRDAVDWVDRPNDVYVLRVADKQDTTTTITAPEPGPHPVLEAERLAMQRAEARQRDRFRQSVASANTRGEMPGEDL